MDEATHTRKTAEQKIMLKLDLDPTDDIDENTLFKTEHAARVSKVLGNTEKVVEFDTLCYQLKSTKRPSKALRHTSCLRSFSHLFKYKKQLSRS